MHPTALLEIKKVIQDSAVSELNATVRRLLRTTDAEKYAEILKDIAQN